MRPQDEDTICAQATAPGRAGLAALRMSGPKALDIAQALAPFLPQKPEARRAYFGSLLRQKRIIDEVILLYFEEKKSFTGEDVVEIFCHGSPIICEEILQTLQELGCRAADPGEFTYRAYLSGRIDLVQAESLLSITEARSLAAKRQALRHLQGELSDTLKEVKKVIKNILSHIEAGIDFSEEDLVLWSNEKTRGEIKKVKNKIEKLSQEYSLGLRVREGLRAFLFGPVNSGKSTLFNQLLKSKRAITSPKEGTTRDVIEGEVFLQGQRIILADAAGLRPTKDLIEKEGMKKTYEALDKADLVFFVLDAAAPFFLENPLLKKAYEKIKSRAVLVFNKTDLKSKKNFLAQVKKDHPDFFEKASKALFISAKKGEGLLLFEELFLESFKKGEGAVFLPRHKKLLLEAGSFLNAAEKLAGKPNLEAELLAFELKEALKSVQNILGEDVSIDVVSEIFEQFCIGK